MHAFLIERACIFGTVRLRITVFRSSTLFYCNSSAAAAGREWALNQTLRTVPDSAEQAPFQSFLHDRAVCLRDHADTQ